MKRRHDPPEISVFAAFFLLALWFIWTLVILTSIREVQ
jgi:hypothetical protein